MHLQDLARLGKFLQDNNMVPPVYHDLRPVEWVIDLTTDGSLQSISSISAQHFVGDSFRPGRKPASSRNMVEEARYILPPRVYSVKSGKEQANEEHHKDFVEQATALTSHAPIAQAIVQFCENVALEDLEPFGEDFDKVKNVCFRVDGKFVHLLPEIQNAWIKMTKEYKQEEYKGAPTGQCFITGEKGIKIIPLHSTVGGNSLVSFNASSFCSWGNKQNENCPMSEEGMLQYVQGARWLWNNDDHRIRGVFGKDSMAFWWIVDAKGEPVLNKDVEVSPFWGLDTLFDENNQAPLTIDLGSVKRSIMSAWSGKKGTNINTDMVKVSVFEKNMGRWIPKHSSVSLAQILERVLDFQTHATVEDRTVGKLRRYSIHGLAKVLEPDVARLQQATVSILGDYVYRGVEISPAIFTKVLDKIEKGVLQSGTVSLGIQAWLQLINFTKGNKMNETMHQFGKLYYLTKWAHEEAYPNVKKDPVSSMIRSVFENVKESFVELDSIMELALDKLKPGRAVYLRKLRSEIYAEMGHLALSCAMNDDEKISFIMGRQEMERFRFSKPPSASVDVMSKTGETLAS